MGSSECRSRLAQGVQTSECAARKGAAVRDQPGALDRDRRERAVGGGCLQVDPDLQLLADKLEGEQAGRVGGGDDEDARRAGLAEEGGLVRGDDLPAGALR